MKDKTINQTFDPVCGMNLAGLDHLDNFSYKRKKFYFCSKFCQKRFEDEPEKFEGQPLIRLENLYKIFKNGDTETKVLNNLSLNIWQGDFVALIGASGSGKSTCLNMIGLLDRPTSGKLFVNGQDVAKISDEKRAKLRSLSFGFVFQQYNLMPWLTAYDNVWLPRIFAGKKVDKKEIEKNFERIDIKHRITHRPAHLSGGEKQRVALLRALVNDPPIIIGDEPTGNLDSATGEKILQLLLELSKKNQQTLIVVTHDAGIAERADQVLTLKDGQLVRDHKSQKKIYTE
jgi:putative ABC transport system ATP-binding protein